MKNLKKHYAIFKLNRQISHLQGALVNEMPPSSFTGAHSFMPVQRKESEKSFLLRENLNELRAKKATLKKA